MQKILDIEVIMLMYNLIRYSDNYSKASGSLWQYCKDELPLNNAAITESE